MKEKDKVHQLQELLKRYREGNCSDEEIEFVNSWFYNDFDTNDINLQPNDQESLSKKIFQNIENSQQLQTQKNFPWELMTGIAAAFICICFAGYYLVKSHDKGKIDLKVLSTKDTIINDLSPGNTQAILSFSDGTKKQLPDSSSYQNINNNSDSIAMEVPIASTYSMTLKDGTKVWLNSSSKLKYPQKFDSKFRKVELEGEAFFEVAKNPSKPFIIKAKETEILVLGTSFNVNAYENQVATTLVEGSLKVTNGVSSSIIKPGQEAISNKEKIEIDQPNINVRTAWQRGEFFFDGNNLKDIMLQIQRWYNVKIIGLDDLNYRSTFKGTIDKNQNLSNVLKILNVSTGKTFELRNNIITIH